MGNISSTGGGGPLLGGKLTDNTTTTESSSSYMSCFKLLKYQALTFHLRSRIFERVVSKESIYTMLVEMLTEMSDKYIFMTLFC